MESLHSLTKILTFAFIADMVAMTVDYYCKSRGSCNSCSNEETTWSWKETVWMCKMILSILVLILATVFLLNHFRILTIIILVVFILKQTANIVTSAEIVGTIIAGKSKGNLNRNEHSAILFLTMPVLYIFNYDIPQKIYSLASGYPNTVCSDWMMIILYVLTISVSTFLICSLSINPLKLICCLIFKVASAPHFQKVKQYVNKLRNHLSEEMNTKTYLADLILRIKLSPLPRKFLLFILVILAAFLDIMQTVLFFIVYIAEFAIWFLILIIRPIFVLLGKLGNFVISLFDSSVVAISFRVAVIFGLGCTVIINRYTPFLHNQEASTAVLEFVSSVLIIPIILEWISSYNKAEKEPLK